MTCKDCVHYEVCNHFITDPKAIESMRYGNSETWFCFKDKSKLIKLPCKVGDTVFVHDIIEYEIDEAGNNQYLIVPCTVVEIILYKNKIQVKCKESRDCIWTIKENAFITKEAAEAALKEREQND